MKLEQPNIDLNPHDWREVSSILQRHVPELDVWAFGSRAKWTAKSHSDLDLALITKKPLSLESFATLKEAFDESALPIRVDIVDWATTSDTFRRIIERDKVVIQTAANHMGKSSKWVPYKIGEIGRIVTGKTPQTSNLTFQGSDVPFVTPPDFNGRKWIKKTARSISEVGAQSVKNCILPSNAVLVSCIGSDMGKAALSGMRCVTNQQINAIIVDNHRFLPEFVFYNLSLRKDEIQQMAGGSAQPILNKSAFSEIWIDCPSLQEQYEIVEILRPLDDRITLLRETNATLEAIAQALFKSWFVDFDPVRAKQEGREPEGMDAETAALFPDNFEESELGLVPKGWQIGVLQDCCARVESGGTPKRTVADYWNGNVSWLTSGEVRNPIVFDTKEKITELGVKESSAKIWPEGTTVVAMYGATAGEVCLLANPTSANQACCGLIPRDSFRSFLFFCVRRERENIASKSSGSAQQNLNKGLVSGHSILIPSDTTVTAYENIIGVLLDGWIENEQQAQTLSSLRDTLLPRLISGQLRLPEAEAMLEESAA